MLRLLRLVDAPADRRAAGLRWSAWRRAHQAVARRCHIARRARGQPPPPPRPAAIISLAGVPAPTEALIARLLAVLPRAAATGRPAIRPPQILGGIVWVMRTGAAWREVPAAFGPWQTVYGRYRLWQRDGTWDRLAAILTRDDAETPTAQ